MRTTLGVASAVVVGGAGTLAAFTAWVDPTWVCDRRAARDFEQLEALAAPLADKQVGETSRDFECWGSEPQASISVLLPKEVSPKDAMMLLGEEWQVNEGVRDATTADGAWESSSSRWSGGEEWLTMVLFHRS